MRKIDPERIERAARVYGSNQEASCALGIAPGSFSRLCRLYAIETPHARHRRRREECSRRHRLRRILEHGLEVPEASDLDFAEVQAYVLEMEDGLRKAG
ncbi:MAG: hypothetical protein AB1505_09450 [Candidatus Latescibacterota bacterium]